MRVSDEFLDRIMKEYGWTSWIAWKNWLAAGPSGAVAKQEEPKEETVTSDRLVWTWKETGRVWEVGDHVKEEPKRKLSFREWLDGGMKGECQ